MNAKILAAAVATAIAPQVVQAAEVIGTRGDWEVFQNDKSCGMTRTYEGAGRTEMLVIKYAGGDVRIMITNAAWSAKQDELYDISYQVNGASYGGAKAVGTAERHRKGFVSRFVAAFGDDLARGSMLRVLLAGREIERLSLGGSGAAMDMVEQCVADLRNAQNAAGREDARRARLPKDPFASPSPADPLPTGTMVTRAAISDYPPAALREGREGTTSYRLSVAASGRPTNCRVTRSSGHADLDEAACDNALRRARFKPATDARGKAVAGTFDLSTKWAIPKGANRKPPPRSPGPH